MTDPDAHKETYLKPAADIDATLGMGEAFLQASSAISTDDPDEADFSFILPARWKADWQPETTEYPLPLPASQADFTRKTVRAFDPHRDVTGDLLACLSRLLTTNRHGGRSYPSPGRLYPVEVFVCPAQGPAIWFDAAARPLTLPTGPALWQALQTSDLRGSGATVATVLAINLPRISRKYLSRGIRYGLIEAGAIAMRLEIELRQRGLDCFWLGGFDDGLIATALAPTRPEALRPILVIGHGLAAEGSALR